MGFGAPKQELWLKRFHEDLTCKVAIAAGATIDFLAGRQTRSSLGQKLKSRVVSSTTHESAKARVAIREKRMDAARIDLQRVAEPNPH